MDEEKSEVPSEQPAVQTPTAAPPPKKSAAPLAIVLILIIIVGVAAYVLVGGKAWEPAAYMPQEVAIAVTVDVSGSADKDAAISFIRGVLKDAGTEFPEKDLFKELNKQLNMDVEKDVLPKLNGKGGLAILTEMSGMTPGVVLVIGARTANDAKDLVQLVDRKVKENGERTELKKYDAYDYYSLTIPPVMLCVGAVGNGVLCTMSETAFKNAVDTYKGKSSLLKNEYYARLRESGSSTFATTFYSGPGLYKLLEPLISMGAAQMGPEASAQMKKGFENLVAMVGSAMATGDGLKFRLRAVANEVQPEMTKASLADLARNVPAGAAAAFVIPDMKTWWTVVKKQLESSPGPTNPLAEIKDRTRTMLGIDLEKDVLDNVKTFEAYYVAKGPVPKSKFAGYVGAALGVDNPALIAKTLAKVNAAAGKYGGTPFKGLAVSGQKFAVAPLDKEGMQLADGLVKGKVLVTLTGSDAGKDAKAVMDAAQGKGKNLASSDRFRAVAAQLPAQSTGFMYVDLKPVFEAYKSEMSAKDAKIALDITSKVGTLGSAGITSGKESDGYIVVPFMH